jgi:hypothetical protein
VALGAAAPPPDLIVPFKRPVYEQVVQDSPGSRRITARLHGRSEREGRKQVLAQCASPPLRLRQVLRRSSPLPLDRDS